ncbi:hypothetical protein ACFLQI_03075 [Candidatus Undinarchaeota archaeon]
MAFKIKLYAKGIEEYSLSTVVFGNFMMFLWIGLGTRAIWFFSPLIAQIYLAIALIMVYVVLRKLVCTNCYYYDKWCSIGWGKLSAFLFKKGKVEDFANSLGIKLAPVTYGLLSLIPIILILVSIWQGFSISKALVLILLLSISAYSGSIGRKKSCANCKMKLICPGCAAK